MCSQATSLKKLSPEALSKLVSVIKTSYILPMRLYNAPLFDNFKVQSQWKLQFTGQASHHYRRCKPLACFSWGVEKFSPTKERSHLGEFLTQKFKHFKNFS